MINVFIIMTIFSLMILLYGLYIYSSRNPSLPVRYHGKRTKSYLKYLGKTIMLVSLSPFLTGLVSLLGDTPIVVILSCLTMIISFIIIMYYVVKNNRTKE